MQLPALPFLAWARHYNTSTAGRDALAAVIVTVMLIPQSLAYASLAGLPAQLGLYASIAPLLVYALLGTSRVLAVGPVAVVSLMTASAAGEVAAVGTPAYAQAALILALLSGGMLLVMGWFRLGFIANFLSHPVISGFITASAVLIAGGQMLVILGLRGGSQTLVDIALGLYRQADQISPWSAALGLGSLVLLIAARKGPGPLRVEAGVNARLAGILSKAGPVFVIALAALCTWHFGLDRRGVAIVGEVPGGLPPLSLPPFEPEVWRALLLPAFFLSLVGFVESVSVGQTLAARRRQRIEPDKELVALGAGNVAAAFSSGFPVTGGFARSVVNFDAGAETPAAGFFTAVGIALAVLFLTPALYYIPKATLAATIVVAVLSLVDWTILARTWRYAKYDWACALSTILGTLAAGVEAGLVTGIALSLLLVLYRTSRPHIAEVGLVPGTEHFRNRDRHAVRTDGRLLSLRVDESLYFANARALEDRINAQVAANPELKHLVLLCSAVNDIDSSALESLEAIDRRLAEAGITMHLSEVKGPVMDRLRQSDFLDHLHGQIFLSHYLAVKTLTPEVATRG